jgi:hypothetical protein
MKFRSRLRRILVTSGIAVSVLAALTLALFVIPVRYRFGSWQHVPALDAKLLPHLSAIFAGAFGAFFGSLSAFYLGRVQQRADRREKRHGALIAAQYALITQWNTVEGIGVDHLERVRNDLDRFAKLPLFYFNVSPSLVPLEDLTFVLETKDPNLLHEIHLAQQSFHTCVEALKLKNHEVEKFYTNPRVEHHVGNFKTGSGHAIATEGDTLFLRQAVDILYECVDRTLPRLAKAIEKIEHLIKSMFPGKQALKLTRHSPIPRPSTTE